MLGLLRPVRLAFRDDQIQEFADNHCILGKGDDVARLQGFFLGAGFQHDKLGAEQTVRVDGC